MEALTPAPAGHQATGELVDDHHLGVLDHVVAVQLVERLGFEGLFEVARQAEVVLEHVLDPEPALHLVGAGLGDGHLLELLVEDVVLFRTQAWDEPRELDVLVGRFLRDTRDDERRPSLVDQDVVDLVHDREEMPALDSFPEIDHQVVAQVVEAELVVGAVRHVGGVGLLARDRPQVLEPFIRGGEGWIEDVGSVVLDAADAHPQSVEDEPDPLRVALGEVVVDGHDVDAAAREPVEIGGQRRDERLSLAGLHLRDLAAMQDHGTQHLDVVVALPERAVHRLAHGCEGIRQKLIERLVDQAQLPRALLLAALGERRRVPGGELGILIESLERCDIHGTLVRIGCVAIAVRRSQLHRYQELADLVAQPRAELGGLGHELVVGERRIGRLERVDLGHHRLQPADLALVGIHQPGEELHHRGSEYIPRVNSYRPGAQAVRSSGVASEGLCRPQRPMVISSSARKPRRKSVSACDPPIPRA